ncbi:CMRF35-like molecule 8 isoform X1 [Camelus bactrianus]|uniref:CMRF35-like molecule 8 isoform X1 n=2 Tax=Camelus bactrianus TaxID=9837 RepID=A0AC58NPK6_CAMBA
MVQRDWILCLPPAMLLLWVPGCWSLSGPHRVTGVVGGSLSVQCRYKKEFIDHTKYWCKSPCLLSWKMVETTESEREVRNDRVSIRDHPASLTFTVTLESLRMDDAGTYYCGIDKSLSFDLTSEVEVSVFPAAATPAPMSTPPTTTKTSTTTTRMSALSFTAPATVSATYSASSQEESQPVLDQRLQVLLPLLAVLLLLLGGVSLLAWRMVQRQSKAGKNPEPPQNPSQAAEQSEPCYANVELQTWPPPAEPRQPRQAEAEDMVYSTVRLPSESLHYTTVVFDSPRQDSKADRTSSPGPQKQEPVYSLVKKT